MHRNRHSCPRARKKRHPKLCPQRRIAVGCGCGEPGTCHSPGGPESRWKWTQVDENTKQFIGKRTCGQFEKTKNQEYRTVEGGHNPYERVQNHLPAVLDQGRTEDAIVVFISRRIGRKMRQPTKIPLL